MFGLDPLGLADLALPGDHLTPPQVTLRMPFDVHASALVDDHVAHRFATAHGKRLFDDGLQRQALPPRN